jgi:hypothetical protein
MREKGAQPATTTIDALAKPGGLEHENLLPDSRCLNVARSATR